MAGIDYTNETTQAVFDSNLADARLGLPTRQSLGDVSAPSAGISQEVLARSRQGVQNAYASLARPAAPQNYYAVNADTKEVLTGAGKFNLGNLTEADAAIKNGALTNPFTGQLPQGFDLVAADDITNYITQTAQNRGFWSATGEVAKQGAAGLLVEMPEMLGSAMKWHGMETAGNAVSKAGEGWKMAFPSLGQTPDTLGRNQFTGEWLIPGARHMAPSLTGVAAAYTTGNPVAAAALILPLFGGSQAQATYDKLKSAGASDDSATKAAWANYFIEGAGETAADVMGAKLLSGAGQAFGSAVRSLKGAVQGGKMTAEQAAAMVTDRAFLKHYGADMLANAIVQSGTEYGQGYGEASVENAFSPAGKQVGGNPHEAGMAGFKAAGGMSVLMAPLGVPGHVRAARNREALGAAVNDPNRPVDLIAATDIIREEITPIVGEQAATDWMDNSFRRLDEHQANLDRQEFEFNQNMWERDNARNTFLANQADSLRRADETSRQVQDQYNQQNIADQVTLDQFRDSLNQQPVQQGVDPLTQRGQMNREERGPIKDQQAFWKQQSGVDLNGNVTAAAQNPGYMFQSDVQAELRARRKIAEEQAQQKADADAAERLRTAQSAPEDLDRQEPPAPSLEETRNLPDYGQRVSEMATAQRERRHGDKTPDMFSGEDRTPAPQGEMPATLRQLMTAYTSGDMAAVLSLARGIGKTLGGPHVREVETLMRGAKYMGNHHRIMTRLAQMARMADEKLNAPAAESPNEKQQRLSEAVRELDTAHAPATGDAVEGSERRAQMAQMHKDVAGWIERIAKLKKNKKSTVAANAALDDLELKFRLLLQTNDFDHAKIAELAAKVTDILAEPSQADVRDQPLVDENRPAEPPPEDGSDAAQSVRGRAYEAWRRGAITTTQYERVMRESEGSKNIARANEVLRDALGGADDYEGQKQLTAERKRVAEERKRAHDDEVEYYNKTDIGDATELQTNVHVTAIRHAANLLASATKGEKNAEGLMGNEDDAHRNLILTLAPLVNIARYNYHNRDARLAEDYDAELATPASAGRAKAALDDLLEDKTISKYDVEEALRLSRVMDQGSGTDRTTSEGGTHMWGKSSGDTFTQSTARAIERMKAKLAEMLITNDDGSKAKHTAVGIVSRAAKAAGVDVDHYLAHFNSTYNSFSHSDLIRMVDGLGPAVGLQVLKIGDEEVVIPEETVTRVNQTMQLRATNPAIVDDMLDRFAMFPKDVLEVLLAAKRDTFARYVLSSHNAFSRVNENKTISGDTKIAQEVLNLIFTPEAGTEKLTSMEALSQAGMHHERLRRTVAVWLNDIQAETNRQRFGGTPMSLPHILTALMAGEKLGLTADGQRKAEWIARVLNSRGNLLNLPRRLLRELSDVVDDRVETRKESEESPIDLTEALIDTYGEDESPRAIELEKRFARRQAARMGVEEASAELEKRREQLKAAKQHRGPGRGDLVREAQQAVETASIALEDARRRRDDEAAKLKATRAGRSVDEARGLAIAEQMDKVRADREAAAKVAEKRARDRERREVARIIADLANAPLIKLEQALGKISKPEDRAKIEAQIAKVKAELEAKREAEAKAKADRALAEAKAKTAENTLGALSKRGRAALSASDRQALADTLEVKPDTPAFWKAVQHAFKQWKANQFVDGFKSARDFDYYGNKLDVKKRSGEATIGTMATQAVRDITDRVKRRWPNGPVITVLDSGVGHPEYNPGDRGWYDATNNQVILIADQMESPADVVATIFHEVSGHYGLLGAFGEELNAELDKAYTNASVKAMADRLIAQNMSQRAAVEEVLAEYQKDVRHGALDGIRRLVAKFARKMGWRGAMTDAEVRGIMKRASDYAEGPGGKPTGPKGGAKKRGDGVAAAIANIYSQASDSSLLKTASDLANRGMLSLMFAPDLANYAREHGIPAADVFFKQKAYKDRIRQEHEREINRVLEIAHTMKHRQKQAIVDVLRKLTLGEQWHRKYDWMEPMLQEKLDKDQKGQIAALQDSKYDVLSPAEQHVVDEVLRIGYQTHRAKRELLNKEINAEYDAQLAKATTDAERKKIEKARKDAISSKGKFLAELSGPYVPLKRPGDILIVGKSAEWLKQEAIAEDENATADEKKAARKWTQEHFHDGAHYVVSTAATDGEASAAMQDIREQVGEGGEAYRTVKEQYQSPYGHELPFQFVKQMRNIAEEEFGENSPQSKTVNRLITDLYLQMLSDERSRKSELRRMKVSGFNEDLLQSFAMQGFADAHLLSSLDGNEKIAEAIRQMRKEKNDQQRKGVDNLKAARVYNQIMANHFAGMHYISPTNWQEKLSSLTSVWKLTTSPAYWITNLTQTPMMSIPEMAGRHGYISAWKHWMDSFSTVRDAMQQDVIDFAKVKGLDKDGVEAKAMMELYRRGRFDITLAQDLGRFVRTGVLSKEDSIGSKLMDAVEANAVSNGVKTGVAAVMKIPANVEMINRISTGLAAFRLEMGKTGNADKALKYADDVIVRTHGDYSASAAPGLLQQGRRALPVKLMGQFRKFQIIQLGQIIRLARQAVSEDAYKGLGMTELEIKEARAAAAASLSWMAGTYFTMAGALGIPFLYNIAAMLLWIAGAGDDGDQPEVSFRAWTPFANAEDRRMVEYRFRRMFGDNTEAALLFARGVPAAMGVDMSGRLGAGAITQMFPYAEPAKDAKGEIANALLAISGPFLGGLVPDMYTGMSNIARGDYAKGVAGLLPKGVGDLVRTGDMAVNGRTDRQGTVLIKPDEINLLQYGLSGIGLNPTKFSQRTYEAQMLRTANEFYSGLSDELRRAYRAGKTEEAVAGWQQMNVGREAIGMEPMKIRYLYMTERDFARRQQNVTDGVVTTRSTKGMIDQMEGRK